MIGEVSNGADAVAVAAAEHADVVLMDLQMANAEIKNVRKNSDGDITEVGVEGQWDWPVASGRGGSWRSR